MNNTHNTVGRFIAAALLLGMLLVGCQTTPPPPPPPPPPLAAFSEAEYSKYSVVGTGIVEGQAFARTKGGDVKYAAGSQVILTPATAHGVDWAKRCYQQDRWQALDPNAKRFTRATTADGEGRFRFTELPDGDYVIVTSVFWEYTQVNKYGAFSNTTGGFLAGSASVSNGNISKVVLN